MTREFVYFYDHYDFNLFVDLIAVMSFLHYVKLNWDVHNYHVSNVTI